MRENGKGGLAVALLIYDITQKIQHGGPAKLLAKDDLACSINTVKLED